MELNDLRDKLLLATLPHVAFEGWTARAMRLGAADAGMDATMPERLFSGGVAEMVEHFCDYADRRMVADLGALSVGDYKMRDRIALAIRTRLERWSGEREAIRRALSLLALPQNAPIALRATYRTVDTIWYAVGDTAVDFSFYTKRATLAGVYSATMIYWLDDRSDNFSETWAFLDRRIADVMRLPKLRGQIEATFKCLPLPNPRALFGNRGKGRRFGIPGA